MKCCNCSATFPSAFPVDLKILYQLSKKYWHLIFINKISIFANICILTLSEWPLCGHTAFKFDFVRNPFSGSAAWFSLLSFNLFYTHFLNQLILPERVWLKFYPTFRRPIKENLVWPRKGHIDSVDSLYISPAAWELKICRSRLIYHPYGSDRRRLMSHFVVLKNLNRSDLC